MTERLTETYPCDSCNSEFCSRKCYKLSLWAEYVKDKLAEYENAEEEGRLVILPCKIGTIVYVIRQSWHGYVIDKKRFSYGMIDKVGRSVFFAFEEAKKALEEQGDA